MAAIIPRRSWTISGILLGAVACGGGEPALSHADRSLASEVGFEADQLLEIKRLGANLRRLEGFSEIGDPVPADGVTIEVSEGDAFGTVQALRQLLGPGFQIFVSEEHFGIGGVLDEVSVLRGADPFQMLRVMGTNGLNYDIETDAVISRLQEWDADFGLDLHGVSFDWVEATFLRQPADMASFAQQVYEFCPDVVDQGTETVEVLADEMRRSNTLYLWWD